MRDMALAALHDDVFANLNFVNANVGATYATASTVTTGGKI